MSTQVLQALACLPEVLQLKKLIQEDPSIKQFLLDCQAIDSIYASMLEDTRELPLLNENPQSILAGNAYLQKIQAHRDKLLTLNNSLDGYKALFDRYWSLAYNLLMIQPTIEALKSNDQRNAYIEQVWEDLISMRRRRGVLERKLQAYSDTLSNAFFNLQQQQRNLNLVQSVLFGRGIQ